MKKNPVRIFAVIFLLAATIAVVAVVGLAMSKEGGQDRDFIAYWAAGQQLVRGENPYDTTEMLRVERAAGYPEAKPFMLLNLPMVFFLTLPLGFVSVPTGMILWLLMIVSCFVVAMRMLRALNALPGDRLYLIGYGFAPVLACFMAGQVGTILLLGIALFLYFHKSRPFLAGAAVLFCAPKPQLFVPFGIVLLAWSICQRAYRLLAAIGFTLLASCAFVYLVDAQAWSQYASLMNRSAEIRQDFIPTVSLMFRLAINPNAVWLQFVPVVLGCSWGLWYFWRHRANWSWLDQGLLLLLVSELCAPHSWFTDETFLLPAVIAAAYRSQHAGRSLLPFAAIAGVAWIEVLAQVRLTSIYYLWTTPAWLGWYLYATRNVSVADVQGSPALAD